MIEFLCPNEKVFLNNFNKCKKCKDKENCLHYIYEKKYQESKDGKGH